MKGHKRFRAGAWRLSVAAGIDPVTGRRRSIYETVRAPNNRAGAKEADARLAALIVEVESGEGGSRHPRPNRGTSVSHLAQMWQEANRPARDAKSGEWSGWSPKTAKTVGDDLRLYILPAIGTRPAASVSAIHLDQLYRNLLDDNRLAPSTISRVHRHVRALYNWALRKKLVTSNPALGADPPRIKSRRLEVPEMSQVRNVVEIARASSPDFAVFIQLAATVGARRGTLVALRWGDVDLDRSTITFSRSIAESMDGLVEKGTKSDRTYAVSLGLTTTSELAVHRKRCDERASLLGIACSPKSFVFSDDGGLNHWSLGWPSHAWLRYSHKAGMTGIRLHDLRHTAASQMLMAGIPVSVVAERLGCTEGNIFATYRHFVPGADRQAAELMDRLFTAEESETEGAA